MDKKQDSSRELYEEVKEKMDANKLIELREMLEEYHTMDIYDVLLELDENDQVKLFEILPLDTAASILEECDTDLFNNIVSNIDKEHMVSVFDEMSLGDLADILRELDEDEREKILDIVSKEDEKELRELLAYMDETSGSTMKKGYVTVNKNLNVAQAIKHIRREAVDADSIYYIYVVDNEQKLVGVLSLRDLFLSKDTAIIEDIMVENVKSVADTDDREEAVKLVAKYNLVAIPVVDSNGVLKGIITVDDILDVMEEEATEDMYKFAGSSERERDAAENENSTLAQLVFSSIRGRIDWLAVTAILSVVTSIIFMKFKSIIGTDFINIIFFVPLVTAMAGSVASQSSAVTVINITNKDKYVDSETVLKELLSSIGNSIAIALFVLVMLFMLGINNKVKLVVSITLVINMVLGALIGLLVPTLFKKLEWDPSVISATLVTVLMDIIGIFVYYMVISVFLVI